MPRSAIARPAPLARLDAAAEATSTLVVASVKTHLRSNYRRLDVSGRRQALARATELLV